MARPQSTRRMQAILPGMVALTPRASATPGYRRDNPEEREQIALIAWRDLFAPRYPEIGWLHAIPNGYKMGPRQAARAKAAGLSAGVWDLFLPYPCNACGLYIEMKSARGRLSADQIAFRQELEVFYIFLVCRSWIDAARGICDYLEWPASHPAREGLTP